MSSAVELAGLYEFKGRRLLLGLIAIPLLIPSFLSAIGISELSIALGAGWMSGTTGVVIAFSGIALPLEVYASFISTRWFSRSQIDSVRLAGGERRVLRYAARAASVPAFLTASLAAILTLSDPGPGQILGFQGAPYEILLSFSALYDFDLAARQCLLLSAVVLIASLPISFSLAPYLATEFLGRHVQLSPLGRHRAASIFGPISLGFIASVTVVLPALGILKPLVGDIPIAAVFSEVRRTLINTILYSGSAAVISTLLGFVLAVAVGRSPMQRRIAIVLLFLLFSLPPSLNVLGAIKLGTGAPEWLDFLFRSRLAVGLISGLRFLPVAALFGLRAFGATAPSQVLAGAVHGLSLVRYSCRILGPTLLPPALLSCFIIAFLSSAEVGTPLMLRPPGEDSLPVQIFTVMANAPESLVAALCGFYFGGAALLILLGLALFQKTAEA